MPRPAARGNKRMMQLKRVKVEVWMSEEQKKAFAALAKQMGLPVATLARRAINYAARGGYQAMECLSRRGYD